MLLTQACVREELRVVSVNTDYRHKRHLENLSILKGENITCLYNRSGDVVIKVKEGRLAINREFASEIEVESLNKEDYESYTKIVGCGKNKRGIELRRPKKDTLERFKAEDQKNRELEKKNKAELKNISKKREEESK